MKHEIFHSGEKQWIKTQTLTSLEPKTWLKTLNTYRRYGQFKVAKTPVKQPQTKVDQYRQKFPLVFSISTFE